MFIAGKENPLNRYGPNIYNRIDSRDRDAAKAMRVEIDTMVFEAQKALIDLITLNPRVRNGVADMLGYRTFLPSYFRAVFRWALGNEHEYGGCAGLRRILEPVLRDRSRFFGKDVGGKSDRIGEFYFLFGKVADDNESSFQ